MTFFWAPSAENWRRRAEAPGREPVWKKYGARCMLAVDSISTLATIDIRNGVFHPHICSEVHHSSSSFLGKTLCMNSNQTAPKNKVAGRCYLTVVTSGKKQGRVRLGTYFSLDGSWRGRSNNSCWAVSEKRKWKYFEGKKTFIKRR